MIPLKYISAWIIQQLIMIILNMTFNVKFMYNQKNCKYDNSNNFLQRVTMMVGFGYKKEHLQENA